MPDQNLLEVEIEGMTCTACARRVEKNLNKLEGVTAYVDFATEKAHLQSNSSIAKDLVVEAVEGAGYRVGTGKPELQKLRPRLITGGIASFFAVLFAMVPGFQFDGSGYLVWFFATLVIFYVATPFHVAAFKNLRHLDATMDTLVSLGSLVAYGYSVYLILTGGMHNYFETAAVVPAVVLLGRYIEVKARKSATDSVRALLSAIPDTATIEVHGARDTIQSSLLKKGMIVLVSAGAAIPADGKLLSASASIDASTLSGESLPQELETGDLVSAGTTNLQGEIRIEVTESSSSSRLAKIADLVREATAEKTKLASLTDSISKVFVPAVILISVATYLVWLFLGDQETAFRAAISVLIIACPCALGIAVPMSLVVATGVGTKRSVVIRNPDVLRLLAKAKHILFDKTGTLTDGKLSIVSAIGLGGVEKNTMLEKAAAVSSGSNHPVSKAISDGWSDSSATNVIEIAGKGVNGQIDDLLVSVEKPGHYQNQEELNTALDNAGPNTLVVVAWEGWAHGLIELSDQPRLHSQEAVAELISQGFAPMLLSGDNPKRVSEIASQLGIADYLGDVSPEQKLETISSFQEPVVMVGDGINDVAALAKADVGIAMGSGAHAAQAASAITILDDDPRAIAFSLKLGKRTYRNILQNLGWAFGYNVILIPVAALGLLNPMLAGVAMAFSSVSVVANSLRLKRIS
ncbi:MAG: cation-translocating P-type ATPase [Aquiluna sp.]|nr:cation-translocating P-type ATPase [Aquiluna sp.]